MASREARIKSRFLRIDAIHPLRAEDISPSADFIPQQVADDIHGLRRDLGAQNLQSSRLYAILTSKGGGNMNFYVYNMVCAMVAIYIYISFRISISSYLRVNKNSKTYIKKSQKGFLNYWIYKKINDDVRLGYIFYLNIAMLTLTWVYVFLSVCLGWVKTLSLPIAICNVLLCIAQIPAIIFSDVYWNLENYKKKFVILAKNITYKDNKWHGVHSSFYAIVGILGILAFAIYNICLAI